MPAQKPSYVYSLLVPKKIHDEVSGEVTKDTFIGFIAYCLYKHKKVKWIEDYKERNELRPEERVPDEEVQRWQDQEVHHVKDYQELGEIRFKEIMSQYVKEKIDAFKEEYKKGYEQKFEIAKVNFKSNFVEKKIQDAVRLTLSESQPKSFWDKHGRSIIHSTAGGFLFAFISVLILLFSLGFDFFSKLNDMILKANRG